MFKTYIQEINNIKDLETIINYYYPNQLKRNKMSCPFHKDKTPSFSIVDKGNGAFYKCFSCNEGGDIIKFIQKTENLPFIQALQKAYEILNKPLNLPNIKTNTSKSLNKENLINFYNDKYEKSLQEGDLDKAFELSCKSDEVTNKKYNIIYPFVNKKGEPMKIWDNLNEVLKANNIQVYYNEITKDVEIEGLDVSNGDNQLVEIHSLCSKCGFNVNLHMIDKFIGIIAESNPKNPVADYLSESYMNFDGNYDYIQKLCDAIITPKDYSPILKKTLITKWLINTAIIPFNDGDKNIEGILTLQGKQGIGKTRLIKKLIPIYVKTGLELDPSDKDKVYQCIKYWVAELGELDSTLKRDLAKLKAFITESSDEFRRPYAMKPMVYPRRPYAMKPMVYPRRTSFYATVNNGDFLKDDTGNRRYWVIPVEKIDFNIIDNLDINMLWGEVMHLKEDYNIKHYLEKDELELLNSSNEDFKISLNVELIVEREFDWESDKSNWKWKPTADICSKLNINSTSSLKTSLFKYGAQYKKSNGRRGYITPPYKCPLFDAM
ncbi:VapE domain-containing protein [Romboutsia ilealis]|uniref:VapE domain-containing protein n=1 Tax=Romboutsia ilealis TaxID=1115758 RepID=UPI0025A507EC|nr:VapE domain-containing protein [Romboutsia ilealis]